MKTIIPALTLPAMLLLMSFASVQDKAERGKTIFVDNKCNSCHSVEAAGFKKKSNQKPPDLSATGSEHSAEWISKYLRKQESKNGVKHLIPFKGNDEELKTLAEWLAAFKKEKDKEKK